MVAISLAGCATFPGMLRSWQETASSGGRDWRYPSCSRTSYRTALRALLTVAYTEKQLTLRNHEQAPPSRP